MHVNTPDVAVFDRIFQGLGGKILCTLAGVEGSHAQVNSIGTILYRSPEGIHRTGRGQQFDHKLSLQLSKTEMFQQIFMSTARAYPHSI